MSGNELKIFHGKTCGISCNILNFPDPTWSDWNNWNNCPVTCGEGWQTRTRTCQGGNTCQGLATERKRCNTKTCSGVIHILVHYHEHNLLHSFFFVSNYSTV